MTLWLALATLLVATVASAQPLGGPTIVPPFSIEVQDEGVSQGRASTLNFTGAGVTAGAAGGTATITISGGGTGSGAPTNATYITQTAHPDLSAEQALAGLASGLLTNTTGTGVLAIYPGATCSGEFIRALSSSGAATCSKVGLASDTTGTLATANGGTGLTTAPDDRLLLGNGTTWQHAVLPSCSDPANSKLLYDTATNTFSCGTDQAGSGGGAPSDARYWVGAAHAGLSAEHDLGALPTGLVLNTAGTPSSYPGTSCSGQFPRSLNSSGVATCEKVSLTADVANTLPVGSGGTGQTSLTSGGVLLGNGTGAVQATAAGSANQVLRVPGAGGAPAFGAIDLASSAAVSGVLPAANGGTGQSAPTDDTTLVGNGTAWEKKALPSCAGSNSKLLYDTTTNSFSCGTDQTGGGGGGGSPFVVSLASDCTESTGTLTDCSGLAFSLAANTTYVFRYTLGYSSTNTGCGIGLSVNGPASPSSLFYTVTIAQGGTGQNVTSHVQTTYDGVVDSLAVQSQNTLYAATIAGRVANGPNTGDLVLRFRREAGCNNGTLTISAGSFVEYYTPS